MLALPGAVSPALTLYDAAGRVTWRTTLPVDNSGQYDGGFALSLPKGAYFAVLEAGGVRLMEKLAVW